MKNCLYVGNLPREITEERLRALVETGGKPATKVTIALDKRTKRSRGFAFVELESEEAVTAIVRDLEGTELDGRRLKLGTAYRGKKGAGSGREYEEEYTSRGSHGGGRFGKGRGR
jgi:RNA recognition motif-containing protein